MVSLVACTYIPSTFFLFCIPTYPFLSVHHASLVTWNAGALERKPWNEKLLRIVETRNAKATSKNAEICAPISALFHILSSLFTYGISFRFTSSSFYDFYDFYTFLFSYVSYNPLLFICSTLAPIYPSPFPPRSVSFPFLFVLSPFSCCQSPLNPSLQYM